MTASHTGRPDDAGAVCRRLVDIGIALAVEPELPAVLDRVPGEARGFTGAEAGTIFLREGDRLRFAAVHNDVLADEIGADGYGADASSAVDLFLRLVEERRAVDEEAACVERG